MKDDPEQTTWPEKARAERDKYREFIERLARIEVIRGYYDGDYSYCPMCHAKKWDALGMNLEAHADDCMIVEARCLLGLPVDEWGNLVEEER